MHITELRLAGFKSFIEQTRAPIEPGLTGVVGPNGCGKSNLLEAVRWVMGANSAKAMRAQDMDDVIFAGTAGRPGREHAEVTLVLAGAAGRAPAPFRKEDVLEVSRRIRRGLGSTYRINGKEVRAKDVQLLFADAATGANSPALVRQGQVSELIAAKPENRRRIIEDAAGIAGLHARRHEADLKLRAAEANLARLDEVLAEIEAQAQALKKQARQAERYRGLAHTLRETEALLLHRRWMEARAHEAETQSLLREAERAAGEAAQEASAAARAAEGAQEALAPLREAEMIAAAVLRRLEGVRVGLERDLAEAEAELARADAEAKRVAEERDRLEDFKRDADAATARLGAELATLAPGDSEAAKQALQSARDEENRANAQRAKAEAELEALTAAAAAARARAQAFAEALRGARERLDRLTQRRTALTAQLAALPAASAFEARLAAAKNAADAASAEAETARLALTESEAALKKAEKAEESAWAPYRAAESAHRELEAEVRALAKLAPPETTQFPPVLAEMEVEAGYERALAAALGDDLDASTAAAAPARWSGADLPEPKLPREAHSLTRFVKAPGALAARLALVGVVEAEQGAALQKQLPPGARLVSMQGDLWRWDGFTRRAEAPQPAAAKLEHRNRLKAARAELSKAEDKLARAKLLWENSKEARRRLELSTRELRLAAPRLIAAEAEAARALEHINAERTRAGERRAELEVQLTALAVEIEEARSGDATTEAAPLPAAADEAALVDARRAVDEARAIAAKASAHTQGLARDLAQLEGRRAALKAETAQWRARLADCEARLKALTAEANAIEQRRAAARALPDIARGKLQSLLDEAGDAEKRGAQAGDELARAEAAARTASGQVRAKEETHAAARERRAGAGANVQAAQARLADIAAHAQEQMGKPAEDLAGLAGALISGPLANAPLGEVERRLERLKSERDAAGPVNLRAEEELNEAQARLTELTTEKDDVAQGVSKLRRAITTLNNEGRARLVAAFEKVNAHFSQLFATLFEGGQAALKLTESEDPLEAGLEIFAEPPGKRLTTLSLMSGGEQALTATALIFAVFLANPAPLCVLDEVDAPLDDANVDRFCRMLEEMKRLTTTRFIVITHNPVTMSRMDRLYGVTMPEQGASQLVSVDLGRAQALAGAA